MNDFEMRGRLIVHSMWTELEKIALAEEGNAEPMEQDPDKEERVDPEEQGESPVSGILGSKVVQKGTRARGIPVFDPPEGYQFRPDLQAFAPAEDDAWMTNDRTLGGEAVQNAYNKGRQDEQQDAASNEIKRSVDQSVESIQQQQGQMAQPQQQPPPQGQPPAPAVQQPPTPKVKAPGRSATAPPRVPSV